MEQETSYESNENITIWDDPNSTVETVRGTLTYLEWCASEMARWAKAGKKTQLFTTKLPDGREQICIGRA